VSEPARTNPSPTDKVSANTLNVLLSFAQFEREVTSERIRDKIAASKRKGLWVGGIAPLGYETKDRKILVVEEEAGRVRTIFRRYLELGSLNHLMADLRERGIVTADKIIEDGGTGVSANRTLAALRKMFNWAVSKDMIEISPCAGVVRPVEEESRDHAARIPPR
jgi:DNA invertase Pin-like site-specific DNA recombinase